MIREARREDLPACAALIRESFATVAADLGLTEANAPRFTAFATTPERLRRHMDVERRLMFLDEADGVIHGYCSLCPLGDGACELGNLAVLPAQRHRGIGRALLEHALTAARAMGCREVRFGIVEENAVLRRWYERAGAVHTGTEKYDFFPFTCGYMKFEL